MYIDVTVIDTRPAKDHHTMGPFTVPETFAGGATEYRNLIRERYANEPAEREAMRAQAFWSIVDMDLRYEGPFAAEAKDIVEALASDIRTKVSIDYAPSKTAGVDTQSPGTGSGYRGKQVTASRERRS